MCLPLEPPGNGTVTYISNSINGRYLLGVHAYRSCNNGFRYFGLNSLCYHGHWVSVNPRAIGQPPYVAGPICYGKNVSCILEHVFLKFLVDTCLFVGHWCWLPFCTSGDRSQTRVYSLIHTWWRHMWCTFPENHLWCNTCWALHSQHGSQSLFPHKCFSRGRMLVHHVKHPVYSFMSHELLSENTGNLRFF